MHLVLLKYHELSLRLIQHHWISLDDADMCHGQNLWQIAHGAGMAINPLLNRDTRAEDSH